MRILWSRRSLVKNLALAAGAGIALRSTPSRAAAASRLDPKDPAAVALGYVADAAAVADGHTCANCMQLAGRAGDAYRPCAAFPGKLVSVKGWCKAWTPEM